MGTAVRKAAVAGSWYPGTAAGVVSAVEEHLAAAGSVSVAGRLVGFRTAGKRAESLAVAGGRPAVSLKARHAQQPFDFRV